MNKSKKFKKVKLPEDAVLEGYALGVLEIGKTYDVEWDGPSPWLKEFGVNDYQKGFCIPYNGSYCGHIRSNWEIVE